MDIEKLIDEIRNEGNDSKKEFTIRIISTSKMVISGAPTPFIKAKAKELVKVEKDRFIIIRNLLWNRYSFRINDCLLIKNDWRKI